MTVVVGFLAAVAVVFGVLALVGYDDERAQGELVERIPPEEHVGEVARAWLDAWAAGDVDAMVELAAEPPADLAEKVASFRDGLRITALRVSPRTPSVQAGSATVEVDAAADLEAVGTWTYTGRLQLVLPEDTESDADWRVVWSREALHPALTEGRRLRVARVLAPRAPLLAADGTPLTGEGAAPTPALAAQLVGRVGAREEDGRGRLAGDRAGLSGLEAAFDAELGGGATADVEVVEGDTVVDVVGHVDGAPPQPVRTSIDLRVQAAAESALAELTQRAALVSIRPSTGEVVAAVSNPVRGFNRALNGRYPPGSTFKIVTTTALLTNEITPDSPASCPEVTKVNGREFRNAEGAALGDIPFRRAFYESCNTAFVQLATGLEPAALVAAAERYGFNAPPSVEVPAETPSFPEPHSLVDQASAAIGQGRVLATPLQMASVAATVASGARRPPTFRAPAAPAAGEPLPPGVAATLQELMRLVVREGTGTAAQLPGAPVAGKTGTAEFGSADPPQTHAWFVGFRGDLAVAVVVEDGGFGGRVAAPVARDFFSFLE